MRSAIGPEGVARRQGDADRYARAQAFAAVYLNFVVFLDVMQRRLV